MKSLLCSIFSTALALASVGATTTAYTATYDDIAVSAIFGNAIGTYKALTYNAFRAFDTSKVGFAGVTAHSPPIVIETEFVLQNSVGTPSITVAAPGKTFTLKDLWFGCVIGDTRSTNFFHNECTITLAAFLKANDQEVAIASYTFTPPASVKVAPMIHVVLPSGFANVYNVTVVQSNPRVNELLIDNVGYTVTT